MVASSAPSMLAEVLLEAANAAPQRIALRFLDPKGEEKALTFAALDSRARSVAQFLSRRVEAGAALLLAFPPGLDFLPAFLGCLYARVLAVPVAVPLRASDRDRIEKIAVNCHAVVGLTVREIRGKLPGLGGEGSDPPIGAPRSSGSALKTFSMTTFGLRGLLSAALPLQRCDTGPMKPPTSSTRQGRRASLAAWK